MASAPCDAEVRLDDERSDAGLGHRLVEGGGGVRRAHASGRRPRGRCGCARGRRGARRPRRCRACHPPPPRGSAARSRTPQGHGREPEFAQERETLVVLAEVGEEDAVDPVVAGESAVGGVRIRSGATPSTRRPAVENGSSTPAMKAGKNGSALMTSALRRITRPKAKDCSSTATVRSGWGASRDPLPPRGCACASQARLRTVVEGEGDESLAHPRSARDIGDGRSRLLRHVTRPRAVDRRGFCVPAATSPGINRFRCTLNRFMSTHKPPRLRLITVRRARSQWKKWRSPVKYIVTPASRAAAMTSLVAHGSARLHDGGHAPVQEHLRAVGEGEERIGCRDRAARTIARALHREMARVHAIHLAHADADGGRALCEHDGVGLDGAAGPPREHRGPPAPRPPGLARDELPVRRDGFDVRRNRSASCTSRPPETSRSPRLLLPVDGQLEQRGCSSSRGTPRGPRARSREPRSPR